MSSPIALQELLKATFDDIVIPTYETAPFTTIQNRAKVTRSLKAVAGIERVMCNSINRLDNEFGPNGEQVWELESKDSRIRFVGNWFANSSTFGNVINTTAINNYCEVTFYGTGLNILAIIGSGLLRDARVSVDGGVAGSNIFPGASGTQSLVISNRNYDANQVTSAVSGLSLGWHTAKIDFGNAGTDTLSISGFEILNERTDIAVNPGAAVVKGNLAGLTSLAQSSFKEGIAGTKGGHVVKYIENGQLKTAVTETDLVAKYLTNTDHTNEEVVRRINFREFGANRADDFSLNSGSGANRFFTLDDGTTTLVLSNGFVTNNGNMEAIWSDTASAFYTITFVGTGLDIINNADNNGPRAATVSIDGAASVGTISKSIGSGITVSKICSGLPYGTHTVKFVVSGSFGLMTSDFIVYQPKKPTIPVGAFEVADYSVMADYSTSTTTSVDIISTGVLRKSAARELTYVNGTGGNLDWGFSSLLPANQMVGAELLTSRLNAFFQYTFFGTGVEFRYQANTNRSSSVTVTINGLVANTTNFPSLVVTARTGSSFNTSTGVWNPGFGNNVGSGISLSGLPLGRYTIRATNNESGTNDNYNVIEAIDVITPIHINDFRVGSLSLNSFEKNSSKKDQSIVKPDLGKAKAWVSFNLANGVILASHNVSGALRTNAGACVVFFQKPFKNTSYITIATSQHTGGVNSSGLVAEVNVSGSFQKTPSGVGLFITNVVDGSSGIDRIVFAAFFGELIDE